MAVALAGLGDGSAALVGVEAGVVDVAQAANSAAHAMSISASELLSLVKSLTP